MARRHSNRWYARVGTVAAVFALIVTAGCMHHPGGIAPSTKPVAPGGYTVLGKVRGQDCVYYALGLIPVTGGNETRNAVADALDKKKMADALVDVTVEHHAVRETEVDHELVEISQVVVLPEQDSTDDVKLGHDAAAQGPAIWHSSGPWMLVHR